MAHKDFTLAPARDDPPTFSVAGREFKCLPEPPAGVLTDFVATADGTVASQVSGLVTFIAGCLSDADADQFLLTIHDKDTIVPLETLGDIAQWLSEEYTGRPTTPSSTSPAGSTTTAATSEDGASTDVSTATPSDLPG